jgi:uncharacterized protein (TIGR02145 family)
MKRCIWIYSFIFLIGMLYTFNSCKYKSETVADIDGNIYHTVKIGKQIWMLENLKTTKYSNGDPIQSVIDGTKWCNLKTGAFCFYNNSAINVPTYGALYNWYAVNDSRSIAPKGWHIPTDMEWAALEDYLGGSEAGGKLKEIGTTHWNSPNTGATNESGFSALPGGFRDKQDGGFACLGQLGFLWLATEYDAKNGDDRGIHCSENKVRMLNDNKTSGFSVRCIKNSN